MKKVSTITEFDVVTKYINSFGRDSDDDSYMCKTFFFKICALCLSDSILSSGTDFFVYCLL